MNSFGLYLSVVLCILLHSMCVYGERKEEKWLTWVQYLMPSFMLSLSIKSSLIYTKKLFISKLAITWLHWWHNHSYSLSFSLDIFIPPSPPLSRTLPHQILSANAKSLSSACLFCSYLMNINSDSLPLFVSVFVISPMLEMPVKKQIGSKNWTGLCFLSAWLGMATSGCCLLCHWNVCCLEGEHIKSSSGRKLFFEYALKSTE